MLNIRNSCQLTEREIEILQFLAQGWNNQLIADKLCITVRTIKFHTNNIYAKLSVTSRSQAIVWAWKHGEIQSLLED